MSDVQEKLRVEVEVFHAFLVAWFNGTAPVKDLQSVLVPRVSSSMRYIDPEGVQMSGADLTEHLRKAHGSNGDFDIGIRDVEVLHETAEHLLVLYTEWQTGALRSAHADNGRVATALLSKTEPFQWLHVHETWLPDSVQSVSAPKVEK